jgi:hypothetical protein
MKLVIHTTLRLFAAAAVLATAHADPIADAAPQPITLSGSSSYDEWSLTGLSASANPGYPGFPGSGAWPAPIGSNLGGDAFLSKIANGTGGGPYPGAGSLYYGGFSSTVNNNGGTLAVSDTNIGFELNTIVFQIEIGETWTYDFFNGAMPTLSFNGGSQNLVPTFTTLAVQAHNGTVTMPTGPEDVFVNLWALQWDLSGISEPISSYSISWTGVQHAQIYGLRLDASSAILDSAVFTAVPEPHEYALAISALLFVAVVVRRRRARA